LLPPDELIESGDMARVSAPLDFLGLNYYCPYYVGVGDWDELRLGESPLPGYPGAVSYVPQAIPRTNMGWLVEPEGLYDALRTLDREAPQLPLYITENGCAADDYVDPEGRVNDFERVDYLEGHLDAAWRAIDDGVNLAGYFAWSLMDNFEWARGYQRRFGLYFVDFGTQRRIPKASAGFYSVVASTNALPSRSADGAVGEHAFAAAEAAG
jgi:beta-glucosidase